MNLSGTYPSSAIRNKKRKTLQPRVLHRIAPYLSSGILPTAHYRSLLKSLHTKALLDYNSLLTHDPILQFVSPLIAAEETNLPHPYGTTLSQLRLSFCSSFHSYGDMIGPIRSPSALPVE